MEISNGSLFLDFLRLHNHSNATTELSQNPVIQLLLYPYSSGCAPESLQKLNHNYTAAGPPTQKGTPMGGITPAAKFCRELISALCPSPLQG